MKYLIAIFIGALAVGIIGLIVLSGCVTNKNNNNTNLDDNQLTKISEDLNKNSTLNNTDNQISNDLNELNTDETITTDDPEIQAIDSDMKELDTLLQDNSSDPLAGLN